MRALPLSRLPLVNEPRRVLAHCPATVSCLPITVFPIPGEGELVNDIHPTPRIFVAQQGQGRRWYRRGGRTKAMYTAPRMIEMYERGLDFDHCQWEGDVGRCVMVEFGDADVEQMTHGELRSLPLPTHHELFDDKVSRITLELADEALSDLPTGTLYVQGLCVALVGLLARRYGNQGAAQPAAVPGRLGPAQQKRLTDLIHFHLGADLSLTRLANEVDLSVHHLVRVFKATFGTTPHRYVQERRLEAAAEALQRQCKRSIADIALEHGFASQAHLTDLMRRRLGTTPRTLRR